MGSSRLREWLSRIAPIYPGEGAVALLCLGVNLLAVAGIMFGRNARDALFLVYFGVQFLPYMYFANAAFLVLCSVAYTALVDRIERSRFLAGISFLFVAGLAASRLLLVTHPRWFFPVLYIEAQVIWYFSLMQFWTFAGDLFDTRQAKRLFPLLAIGALLGMMGVGVGSQAIVHSLGTENLLLLWAGLIFAATVLGGVGFRCYRTPKEPLKLGEAEARAQVRVSEWKKIKEGFAEVGREPLERSLAGYILLLWTVYAVVDFCFSKTMRARYPNPNDLATFFGHFVGVQGFLCLAVQIFFTRAVISGLGVGTTINFHPTTLILGTAWMSVRYGYASVLATKLGDATMLYTFSDSSYQLLYNPIPPDRRARVRGLVEGYIRPISLAAAGGLVLAGNRCLQSLHLWGREIPTTQQLSWGALALAAMWLGFALTAKKGYIRALLRNLQAGSPALREAAASALSKLRDPDSLALLCETLQSENPERVVVAVQFLDRFGNEDVTEAIAALLAHPNARVRATAVSALGRRAGAKAAQRLLALLEDPDPRVRANVVEALATTQDPAVLEKIRPLLQDASTRARINAVLTLASLKGVSAAVEWMPVFQNLARGDRSARSAATYALGRLPLEQSMDLLAELLKDPEMRCEAAQALGRIGTPRVIPQLIEARAGPPDLRHDARRSIVAILQRSAWEHTEELMKTALVSPRPEIRSELADMLGRLRDFRVLETLIPLLKDPEWRVRWKVLKSFERLARTGPLPENARAALFDYARDELAAFRQSLLCSRALVPHPNTQAERVLEQALEEDRGKIEERVFRMLGVLCGRDRMQAIFQKLNSGIPRLKADALEALETLAPKGIAREVLTLLEPAPATINSFSLPPEPCLATLAHHGKPWVRACTAYYLGYHPDGNGKNLLKTLLQDREPAVRETALYAGWLAFREAWRPLVDTALRSPDTALQRCSQRILGLDRLGEPRRPGERNEVMLLTVEKVLILKSAPLFAALDSEELAALAEIAIEKEYEPGEIIFEEKQVAHHLYVTARGRVEVFRRLDSTEHSIAFLEQEDAFGEMAILDDEPRSASVRAVLPTLVLKIDRENFHELILERPQISFAIFKMLTSRLRLSNLEVETPHGFDSARHYA
jgi:HEAT repeat protein/ATP/ADP translocase